MRFATIVFDFDSTIVDCETLDLVSEVALGAREDRGAIVAEVKRITALGMEGAIPFDESLARRIALMAPTRDAVETIKESIVRHISASFSAHAAFFAEQADALYIVSGGFDELIYPVSDALGMRRDHVLANAFVYDAAGTVAGVDRSRPTAHAGGKVAAVRAAGLPGPLLIVGDGWTDYELKREGVADAFIAYIEHARREKVVAASDTVARSFDDVLAFIA